MSDETRESKSSDIPSADKTTGEPHYAIHGGQTADIVSSVKSYLLEYPAKLFIAKVKYRKLQTLFVGNCRINGGGKCRF